MTERITADHLSRLAIVYVRQSSPGQVQNNRESTRRQYAMTERARAFGWPEQLIETIDGDLGMSGAVAGLRRGFDQLCRKVELGQVGAVFGIEMSRLSRNQVEWVHLVDLCCRTGTLIVEDSHVYTPGRNDDDLILGIKGAVNASELSIIKSRLLGGQRNKAKRGALYSNLPAGYVLAGETLVKDPDQQVRDAIERVFSAFQEAGTARAAAQLLRDAGVRVPVCRSGRLRWQEADYSRVQALLKNPKMAGVYAWARRPGPLVGPHRENWRIWIPDHHEAYVDLRTWHRIQDQLFCNQGKRPQDRGAPGAGPALLQGLAVCGHCGRAMGSQYNKSWRYICRRRTSYRGRYDSCFSIGGVRVDKLVADSFLAAVGSAAMTAVRAAEKRVVAEREAALRSHRLALQRCRYDASLAERRYRQVDPDNRLIAATLERDWELALREQARARQQLDVATAEHSPEPDPKRLAALGRELPRLWAAEETTARDRKRLLACLLDDVILSIDREAMQIRVVMHWKGGRSDDHHMPVLGGFRKVTRDDADTVDLLHRLAAFYPDWEIARVLNRQKRTTARGLPFTAARVGDLRRRHGVPVCPPPEPDASGAPVLSGAEAAAELGVTKTTLYRWVRKGLLPSIQPDVSGAPMRIRLTDDIRARFCPEPPDGYVPLATAVARLGVSRQTIWTRMQAGTLPAIFVTLGRNRGLHVRISPDLDTPLLAGLACPDSGQVGEG